MDIRLNRHVLFALSSPCNTVTPDEDELSHLGQSVAYAVKLLKSPVNLVNILFADIVPYLPYIGIIFIYNLLCGSPELPGKRINIHPKRERLFVETSYANAPDCGMMCF